MNRSKKKFILFLIFALFLIVLIIIYGFNHKGSSSYDSKKIDPSQYFVYTNEKKESGHYYQYIPTVNLKGEVGEIINRDLVDFTNQFSNDNVCITYESDLNGKVLSILIKVEDYGYVESAVVLYFRSYHIQLDSMELLSDDVLLRYFDLTREEVTNRLKNSIYDYYHYLVQEKNLHSSECDYYCFLRTRNLNDGLEDISYYVKDGQLLAYKPYTYLSYSKQENVIYPFIISESSE